MTISRFIGCEWIGRSQSVGQTIHRASTLALGKRSASDLEPLVNLCAPSSAMVGILGRGDHRFWNSVYVRIVQK